MRAGGGDWITVSVLLAAARQRAGEMAEVPFVAPVSWPMNEGGEPAIASGAAIILAADPIKSCHIVNASSLTSATLPSGSASLLQLQNGSDLALRRIDTPPTVIFLPDVLISRAQRAALRDEYLGFLCHAHAGLFQLGMLIADRLASSKLEDQAVALRLIETLLKNIVPGHGSGGAEPCRVAEDRHYLSPFHWRAIDRYIAEHLNEKITLADLSQIVGCSHFHLIRLMKLQTGDTPHQYVVKRRIDRAKQLLGSTDLGVAEIALATGFANQPHFSTTFLRATGTTPARYRREVAVDMKRRPEGASPRHQLATP